MVAALAAPAGRALLAGLGPYRAADALATLGRLRADGVDPDLAAAALTQARLRDAARARLGPAADSLLFTADGAEQATRTVVADLHAARFSAARVRRVADLGCGIGADSLALLRAGVSVLAVDRDPVTAAVAAANLAHAAGDAARAADSPDSPAVEVRCADALTTDLSAVDALFADPARRAGGRRILDPERWSPPLSAVLALRGGRPTGVKVAPGITHEAIPADAAAEWISVDGDLVEAGLWFGAAAPEGPGRTATLVRTASPASPTSPSPVVHRLRERPDAPGADDPRSPVRPAAVRAPGAFLHEPDDAVLRAGLIAAVADRIEGAGLLSDGIAYLTSDAAVGPGVAPFVTSYRVLDVLPFQLKRLRALLRGLDVGPLTIKKRGTAVDPEDLRRRLGLRGARPATIVLTRVAGTQSVLLVEPAN